MNYLDTGTLNKEDMAANEQLMAEILEKDFNVDASLGTSVRELAVRPAADLATRLDASLKSLRNNMTLSLAMSQEDPDSDLVDALASNFRLTRRTGSEASGVVGVHTSTSANVYLSEGTTFEGGGMTLVCAKTYIGYSHEAPVEDSESVSYRKMIKTSEGWLFTVPVYSSSATGLSLPVGQSLTMNPSDSNVIRTEVVSSVTGGSEEESDESLLNRAFEGITAAVPSGKDHLKALIARDVPSVTASSVEVFGMGDPEMLRDRLNAAAVSMGGRVDAYVRTAKLTSDMALTLTAERGDDGGWFLTIDRAAAPGFYTVASITPVNGGTAATNISVMYGSDVPPGDPVDIRDPAHARFSSYQTATVFFDWTSTETTGDFVVVLPYMPGLDVIQDYLNETAVSNPAQDVVVKGSPVCFTSVALTVTYPPGVRIPSDGDVKAAVSDKINSLDVGQEYLTADEVCLAVNDVDETYRVDFPIKFTTTLVKGDGTSIVNSSTDGRIDSLIDEPSGITLRNTCFICSTTDVEVLFKERNSIT